MKPNAKNKRKKKSSVRNNKFNQKKKQKRLRMIDSDKKRQKFRDKEN